MQLKISKPWNLIGGAWLASSLIVMAAPDWAASQKGAEKSTAESLRKAPGVRSDRFVFKTIGLPEGGTLDLDLRIDRPKDGAGPFPVVFFVHGGGWVNGSKGHFTHQSFELAKHGIAGVRLEYRWKSQGGVYTNVIEDVLEAIDFVRQRADELNLDFSRVGLAGGSAGGHLSAIAAQLTPECISYDGFNGLYDAFDRDNGRFGRGDYTGTTEAEKKQASALYLIKDNPPDTLLYHGTADTTIDIAQSYRFAEAIRKKGGQAKVLAYEGVGHSFFNKDPYLSQTTQALLDHVSRVFGLGQPEARETVDFDAGWRFRLGDPVRAEQPDFPDAQWRTLDVPHDWAFEADYAPDAAQTDRGGYKPGGIGWYRKAFSFSKDWKNKRVFIEFDGVFMNSEVWVNGHLLGKRPYGYISFDYDLTDYLVPGKNQIAVRVDCSLEPAARWYHGCGIYGHVRLVATAPVHLAKDGVFITTPEVSADAADVVVKTEVTNLSGIGQDIVLETILFDPAGKMVGSNGKEMHLDGGATSIASQTLNVAAPALWDVETPNLYRAVSRIKTKGGALDEITTCFGIRTIRWEKESGFWLNGKNIKLKGVCDHLEAGSMGAASPDEIIRWKIQLLKEMGCNAIRTAHNPQVPVFYDLCDEMGMLVMDEVFDGWKKKADEDYGKQAFDAWWERDLRAFLRRDRNHPSVVIWSMGNETRGEVGKALVRVCHELDPTRLATSGHSASRDMDVEGVNGASEKRNFYRHAPDKIFVATENPHTWQVRGYYRTQTWYRDGYPSKKQDPFPCPDLTEEEIFHYDWAPPGGNRNPKQIFNSSYDNAMVRITARKSWELMRDLPWYSGQFRWTGFDYLGEAGYVHGGWPFRAFMGGALDLAGFKKDLFYFYRSQWTEKPMAHMLPHWTHPTMAPGTRIPVWVYSNCDEVELFLNGKSLGKDHPGTKWDEMQCEWLVPWQPGTLEAVGYRNGKEVAQALQTTAEKPAALRIEVEGDECPIVTVAEVDESGVMNPYAENRIHYHLDGPARIQSLESGNPVNTENNFGTTSRTAFFGLARAFLKTTSDEGDISLVVGAICGEPQLLTSNRVHIDVQSVAVRGQQPARNLNVRYTLDGSEPGATSKKYTEGFDVASGTRVKAAVFDGETFLFSMEEYFAPDQGLYWGDDNEIQPLETMGEQAENANLKGAVVKSEGAGFKGTGYVEFGPDGGSVEWYRENDGSSGPATLRFRYSSPKGCSAKLTVNGKVVAPELFFKSTGSPGRDWKTVGTEVRLESGANHITLSTDGSERLSIDEVSIQ